MSVFCVQNVEVVDYPVGVKHRLYKGSASVLCVQNVEVVDYQCGSG